MSRRAPGIPTVDELGPQLVCAAADEELGHLGYVVVDRTPASAPAGGGLRVAPGLTLDEIAAVARAMTLKWAFLNIPHGGAKAGITVAPGLLESRREEVLEAFGRAIRPLLERGVYFTGPDLGTTLDDVNAVRRGSGAAPLGEGDAGGGRATATTVVQAIRETAAATGTPVEGAAVAIEGFGRVGREIALRLDALGARVVAVSTVDGAVHDPDGLDVRRLAAAARADGDAWLDREEAGRIDREQLLALPVDVLVPCARPWTIHEGNVGEVRARSVVPSANAPLTAAAERELSARGVTVMPDFVANSGGILYPHMRHRGFDFADFVRAVESVLAGRMRRLLEDARAAGEPPSETATRIAWRSFERRRSQLEGLPRAAAARQAELLRRHGLAATAGRVASELHARSPLGGPRAWRWFVSTTLAADDSS